MIPYGHQHITEGDVEAVVAALRSEFLTQGPLVPRFERAVAEHAHARHAVAVNSGTSALHVACLALGIGPGDWVWTAPNTFVASANCARYCGAEVAFVDIDRTTWNMSTSDLADRLVRARRSGQLPKAVIPVHFAGQATEQEAIQQLAREFNFKIIEDASHSIGGSRGSEPVGSCRWSDITVFSFHPVKIITTCEGGMALTNDEELARRLALARTHGITRDKAGMKDKDNGSWYYEQHTLGYNYRMTDIAAALGLSQLKRIDDYVERRNQIAKRYDRHLAELPLNTPVVDKDNRSAFHLYVVVLNPRPGHERNKVFNALQEAGIGVAVHYIPVYRQPYFQDRYRYDPQQFPNTELYYSSCLSLPIFPAMEEETVDLVVENLRHALNTRGAP
jgi:UDP-4-amino-4,6-dideoxy-N-acetyl-beta-L-altrosamine transaminase